MQFDWWTLALQIVNFAILVWLLHRFLYKPVLGMIDARRKEVDKTRADAEKLVTQAQAERTAIAAERAGIAAERAAAQKAAAQEAEAAATARLKKAELAAAALLDEARKTVAAERTAAVIEARQVAMDLGVDIARRLVDEIPATQRSEGWLVAVERHLAGLAPAARAALLDGAANGAAGVAASAATGGTPGGDIQVVTAVPLPETNVAEWRKRLQQALGDGIAMTFSVDPLLIAGVDLHFPAAVLRFSWRDELADLRRQLEAHGKIAGSGEIENHGDDR